jgi:hypothetical protein
MSKDVLVPSRVLRMMNTKLRRAIRELDDCRSDIGKLIALAEGKPVPMVVSLKRSRLHSKK